MFWAFVYKATYGLLNDAHAHTKRVTVFCVYHSGINANICLLRCVYLIIVIFDSLVIQPMSKNITFSSVISTIFQNNVK